MATSYAADRNCAPVNAARATIGLVESCIELLAPARDLECGMAAINCGADAVYIGAPKFGARAAAGNSLPDISALVDYAHRYWARVYVVLNTLLHDDEIPDAVNLAWQAHDLGADALIVQDMGLLECKLPPMPLFASTQTHNHTPERVAFLESAGFHRAILARELSLEQIRSIRAAAPKIEIECFVHGALCVCYSGQCYLSYALGGRSGNRGECAQPCRKHYRLLDNQGTEVANGHLLSIRDLNLTDHLADMIEAGVTSFKIEGRLKDARYVSNVVAHYSARLNALGVRRSSSGRCTVGFSPNPAKTFNRGFTNYFLHDRTDKIGSHETPKMVGEGIGRVLQVRRNDFVIKSEAALHAGDGICFFDRNGELRGTLINHVAGEIVKPEKLDGLEAGTELFRNHDHEFICALERSRNERRIAVRFKLRPDSHLEVSDEDGNAVSVQLTDAVAAKKPEVALETLRRQLERTGDTEFESVEVEAESTDVPFLPVSVLNALRRDALAKLRQIRAQNRPALPPIQRNVDAEFPARKLDYRANVLNDKAAAFYRGHGVVEIEPAAESGLEMTGRRLMTTRYCLKYELGMCGKRCAAEPLSLIDDEGNRLELRFDCKACEMHVYLGPPRKDL